MDARTADVHTHARPCVCVRVYVCGGAVATMYSFIYIYWKDWQNTIVITGMNV